MSQGQWEVDQSDRSEAFKSLFLWQRIEKNVKCSLFQVNSALKKIIDLTENSPHVANRHIMIYNHEAKWLENDIGR